MITFYLWEEYKREMTNSYTKQYKTLVHLSTTMNRNRATSCSYNKRNPSPKNLKNEQQWTLGISPGSNSSTNNYGNSRKTTWTSRHPINQRPIAMWQPKPWTIHPQWWWTRPPSPMKSCIRIQQFKLNKSRIQMWRPNAKWNQSWFQLQLQQQQHRWQTINLSNAITGLRPQGNENRDEHTPRWSSAQTTTDDCTPSRRCDLRWKVSMAWYSSTRTE